VREYICGYDVSPCLLTAYYRLVYRYISISYSQQVQLGGWGVEWAEERAVCVFKELAQASAVFL